MELVPAGVGPPGVTTDEPIAFAIARKGFALAPESPYAPLGLRHRRHLQQLGNDDLA